MVSLKCICISDLQCGAPTGLLTSLEKATRQPVTEASEAVSAGDPAAALSQAFGAAMQATLGAFVAAGKPKLLLLGDVLDLSLGTPASAAASFSRFVKDLGGKTPDKLFSGSYFLPGNHDHDLWTAVRLQNFANLKLEAKVRWGHVSPAREQVLPGPAFLEALLRDAGFPGGVETHYPNLCLSHPTNGKGVLFHHGHFTESMYRMMSQLTEALSGPSGHAESLEELEQLNSSWIDFFWSTIGDNGLLGRDMRLIYEYLLTGAETADFLHRLARLLADRLADRMAYASTATRQDLLTFSQGLVDYVVGSFGQTERYSYTSYLTPESAALLRSYIAGPSRRQLIEEFGETMPSDLGFAFGHTHKPFESLLELAEFDLPLRVVNTGGWILDTPVFGTCEGASVLFVDTEMNMASLRLFNVPEQDGDSPPAGYVPIPVTVRTPNGLENDLSKALAAAVAANQALWTKLSVAADAAYRDKQAYSLDVLADTDASAMKGGQLL